MRPTEDAEDGLLARLRAWLGCVVARAAALMTNTPDPLPPESPYRDSTQIGIAAEGTFTPDDWGSDSATGKFVKEGEDLKRVTLCGGTALTERLTREFERGWSLVAVTPPLQKPLPVVCGTRRIYSSFKPCKMILDEYLVVTFANERGEVTVASHVDDASDLALFQVFAGARNCFPTAPDQSTGVSGAAFGPRAVGNGIDWPTVNAGVDFCVGLAVKKTALYRVTPPEGYTSGDVVSVRVVATVNLLGAALR